VRLTRPTVFGWFPSSCSRRYTQVLEARHSGRDCRNPVHKDVKLRAGNYQNQTLAHRRVCPPWLLDSGNPCRNDGVFSPTKLVYNDVSRSLGTSVKSLFFVPLRTLRETSFSSNDGITRIPRNISTRTDLCITARAPAWPLYREAGASKTPFPSRSFNTVDTAVIPAGIAGIQNTGR